MSQNDVRIPMSKGKRTLFVYALMVLYIGYSAANYGRGVATPKRLLQLDAMGLYSLYAALGTVGMMLALPLVGKICDTFGTKAVAVFGVLFQLVTRFFMIFDINATTIIVLNTLSCFGAGLYMSAPFTMLAEVCDVGDRTKYYGMLTTFQGLGALIGPPLTGLMVDSGYLNLSFISYFPFTILALPFIMALYPNKKPARMPGQTDENRFDFAGIFLLVISISCIVFWLSLVGQLFEWVSPISIALVVVGVLAMILLIQVERKHPNPSVPIHMFKKKRLTYSFICSALVTSFLTVISAYTIVYAQQVMQISSSLSSTITMPMTIAQTVFGVVIGRYVGKKFTERFRHTAMISLILSAAGALIICTLQPTTSMVVIFVASAIGGIGSVVPQGIFPSFFQTELKPEEINAAQGLYLFGGTGGSCLYMALAGLTLNLGGTLNHVFMIAAAFCVAALLFGFIGLRLPREASQEVKSAGA